jgi:hypothetical protein
MHVIRMRRLNFGLKASQAVKTAARTEWLSGQLYLVAQLVCMERCSGKGQLLAGVQLRCRCHAPQLW